MNLVEPALNYGWPAITYGIDYSGAVISPFTEKEGHGTATTSLDAIHCPFRHDLL